MAKIYYFPEPYPDELIGSTLVRAGRHLGLSIKRTHDLFGLTPTSHWPLLFQNQLQSIAIALGKPADELLFKHTPFLYVTSFLSYEQTARMTSNYCRSQHGKSSALSQSATIGGAVARYCEACIEDDQRVYGEDYWHRRHNLPFVSRCWKHGTRLKMSDRKNAGISVIGLPHEQHGSTVTPAFHEHIHDRLERLSIALLDSTFRQPPEVWQRSYRQIAQQRGFPRQGNQLSSIAIAKGFIGYFGKAELIRAGLNVPDKPNSWPVTLLRLNETSNVSAKHILMQVYLQCAPVPEVVTTTVPGPRPLNCKLMDPVFASAIRKRVANLAIGCRITVSQLLNQLGILQQVLHNRTMLPLTAAAIAEFRSTEFSERQTGRRPRKNFRSAKKTQRNQGAY